MAMAETSASLTPVFLSNSFMADFFKDVPDEVRASAILFFGSEHKDIFGKAGEDYDEFIRSKQDTQKFHTLKPPNWRRGQRCDFKEASDFLKSCGFNELHLDMDYYQEHFNRDSLFREAKRHLPADRADAIKCIEENFDEAERGIGCFGHDYGPMLAIVQMADERLFPILDRAGLDEFLRRSA